MTATSSPRAPRPQAIRYKLPPLHSGQMVVWNDPRRFKVLACGRRWGKTRLGALLCLRSALRGGTAWWVAPSYKVAAVGWRLIKRLGQQIPGAVIKEGDRALYPPGGGWVQVRSADDPDSLRGEGLDFVVLDECAFISEAAWTEALRPALSDRKGGALFISTPKGMNWFWHHWVRGQEQTAHPEWISWQFGSKTNPYLDPEEIDAAATGLPERIFQQEYLAEFLEDAGGVFRKVRDAVDDGRTGNEPPAPARDPRRYVLGVDLARVHDWTVLCVLDQGGRQVYHERFNQISWERQKAAVVRVAREYNASVLIDSTGVGDPILEDLQKAGVNVRGYHFTNTSKGALIDALALALEAGSRRLLDVSEQTTELLAYQYELTPSRQVRMNAPEGMHDDCVIALALANWQLQEVREVRADDEAYRKFWGR